MRVMPSFRARRPVRIPRSSELDLDVDAGGEVELHQGVDGLRRRIDDIEHALMRADLELLARLLVDMWRAQHGEFLDLGRQWDRAAHPRAGPLGGVDDLAGRLIEHPVIVGAQADANILVVYGHQPSSGFRAGAEPASLFDDFGDDAGADGAAALAD